MDKSSWKIIALHLHLAEQHKINMYIIQWKCFITIWKDRFWNILYTFTCKYFIQIILIKEKEWEYVSLLSTVSILDLLCLFCQTFIFIYFMKKLIIAKLQYYKNCLYYLKDTFYTTKTVFTVLFLSFKKYCIKTK